MCGRVVLCVVGLDVRGDTERRNRAIEVTQGMVQPTLTPLYHLTNTTQARKRGEEEEEEQRVLLEPQSGPATFNAAALWQEHQTTPHPQRRLYYQSYCLVPVHVGAEPL